MLRCEKKTRVKGCILKSTRIGTVLDVKVCRHEDRYSVEILVESLFQDKTASCLCIVSGIDKYVTESMQTKEEEDIASENPLPKQDHDWSPQWRCLPFQFLFVTENGQTLKHDDHTIRSVSKFKSNDPIATTWSNSSSGRWRSSSIWRLLGRMQEEKVRWCFAMVTQRLDIYSGQRRRSQEKVSMLLESKLFQPLPEPQSNSRTFRRQSYWSIIARQCTVPGWLYRLHLSTISWTLSKCTPLSKVDWSQEVKALEGTGSQCSSQPWTRWMLDKIRKKLNTICTNPESHRINTFGKFTTNSILVQFEACSEKWIAILSNTITCNHSLQHTTCDLY